jgi:hypothetical protein
MKRPDRADQKPCPICRGPAPNSERHPNAVCRHCAASATSPDGRPVRFYNASFSGGFAGCYTDDESPYESHRCLIRGVICHADEARFGGIVIQPLSGPTSPG